MATTHASADSVLTLIRVRGASFALDSMSRDAPTADRWTDSIATGDSAWLLVAKTLRPASDAATSEDLDLGLARALPSAPERVLRILGEAPFDRTWVCGSPFFEDTPESTIVNYTRRATAAVRAVRDSSLRLTRDSCLALLQKT